MSGTIILRLRTKDGTERVTVDPAVTTSGLLDQVAQQFSLDRAEISISRDGPGRDMLPATGPVGAKHGDMLYLHYNAEREQIARYEEVDTFRKLAKDGELRKQGTMEWTLTSYLDYRADREFKLGKVPDPHCLFVSVDANASNNFLGNMQSIGFACQRAGFLYGRFTDDGGVQVDAIYEPEQECTDTSINIREHPLECRAHKIAGHLGLRFVGWIFAHPPRAHTFTINEITTAAQLHAHALDADEAEEGEKLARRFVTLKARLVVEGEAIEGVATVEAYQMTDQCVDLVRKGAFKQSQTDVRCAKTTSADCVFVIEQKESRKATAEHFVSRVHDMSRPYASPLRTGFPGARARARVHVWPARRRRPARAADADCWACAHAPSRRARMRSGKPPHAAADAAVVARAPAAPARRAVPPHCVRLPPARLHRQRARHEHRHARAVPRDCGRGLQPARGLPHDAQRLRRDRVTSLTPEAAVDGGRPVTCGSWQNGTVSAVATRAAGPDQRHGMLPCSRRSPCVGPCSVLRAGLGVPVLADRRQLKRKSARSRDTTE